jgi:hypothetical protein
MVHILCKFPLQMSLLKCLLQVINTIVTNKFLETNHFKSLSTILTIEQNYK